MEVVLEGTEGPDRLFGSDAPERIIGLGGDDTISGGLGIDTMSGGSGVDTIDYDYTGADVDINLESGRALFFNGVLERILSFENVVGSTGDNLITGSDGDNMLFGNDGNDTLIGGLGIDSFDGGAGIDTVDFSYTSADVDIDLAPDGGFSPGSAIFANGAVEVIENVENVIGTNGRNDISAEFLFTGPTRIEALGGDDTISGSAFADELFGGSGDDEIVTNGGADTVFGGTGNDTISFGADDGDVLIFAGDGDDRIFTFGDSGQAFGEAGNDFFKGNDGQSEGISNDFFNGGSGNDTLIGAAGDDTLIGGEGDDRIVDGVVTDDYDFGTGDDLMTGGAGADVFEFRGGAARDTVTDFTQGEDLIDLSAFDESFGDLDITLFADRTEILLDEPDESGLGALIVLDGFTGTLTADDFIL